MSALGIVVIASRSSTGLSVRTAPAFHLVPFPEDKRRWKFEVVISVASEQQEKGSINHCCPRPRPLPFLTTVKIGCYHRCGRITPQFFTQSCFGCSRGLERSRKGDQSRRRAV